MDLSISIVNWNTCELTSDCIRSIYENTLDTAFEIIVVDNASDDGSVEAFRREFPEVNVIANEENVGFAKANNQAYEKSQGKYFVLLNSDTLCHEGALDVMAKYMDQHPEVGICGPLVLNSDGSLQYSWAKFPSVASEALGTLDRRVASAGKLPVTSEEVIEIGDFAVDWIGGACMTIRSGALDEVGLMDDSLFMYSEETDWCMRFACAGWRIHVVPDSAITHFGGSSSSKVRVETLKRLADSKLKFFRKHFGAGSAFILKTVFICKAFLAIIVKSVFALFAADRTAHHEAAKAQTALLIYLITGR